jgi:hypothetical protein
MPKKQLRHKMKKQTVRVTEKEDRYAERVAKKLSKKVGTKIWKEEMYRYSVVKLGMSLGVPTPVQK